MLETGLRLKREGFVELLHDRLSYQVEGYALLNRLVESCEVYIVGGLVRDLLVFGSDAEVSRDIDVVVTIRDREGFERAIEGTEFIINRFGGYKFYVGDSVMDMWELDKTFGIREGEDVSVSDFIECMHLTTDRMAYDYGRDELYVDELETYFEKREIALLHSIDFVDGNIEIVVRDLMRCYYYSLKYGLTFSANVGKLTSLVLERLTYGEFLEGLLAYQRKHFGEIRVSEAELSGIIQELT